MNHKSNQLMSVVKDKKGKYSLRPNVLDDNGPKFDASKIIVKSVEKAKSGAGISIVIQYLYEYTDPVSSKKESVTDYLVIAPPKDVSFTCAFGINRIKVPIKEGEPPKLGDWGMGFSEQGVSIEEGTKEKLVEVDMEKSKKKYFTCTDAVYKGWSDPFGRYVKFLFDVRRGIIEAVSKHAINNPLASFEKVKPIFKPMVNKKTNIVSGHVLSFKLWFKGTGEPRDKKDEDNKMYTEFFTSSDGKTVPFEKIRCISKGMRCAITVSVPSMHIDSNGIGTLRLNVAKVLALSKGSMPGEAAESFYSDDVGNLHSEITEFDLEEADDPNKRVKVDDSQPKQPDPYDEYNTF